MDGWHGARPRAPERGLWSLTPFGLFSGILQAVQRLLLVSGELKVGQNKEPKAIFVHVLSTTLPSLAWREARVLCSNHGRADNESL